MNNTTCETCQRKQGTTNVALDEFYLKNHLGSTVAVMDNGAVSTLKAAYDYRAFGEQVDLEQKGDKVTENFTGKERDDETELNYFGARYLDPMLGLWVSVDPARQFASPYLYAGNGVNPINSFDPDGNLSVDKNVKEVSPEAYKYLSNFKPHDAELETYLNTFDEFSNRGITVDVLKETLRLTGVSFAEYPNPGKKGVNAWYSSKLDGEMIYMTRTGLERQTDESLTHYQTRLRAYVYHEMTHLINAALGYPYEDELYKQQQEIGKVAEQKLFNDDL